MNLKFTFLSMALPVLLGFTAFSQSNLFNIVGSPIDTIPCNINCTSILTEHPKVKKTSIYSDTVIPFSPSTFPNPVNISIADDFFSGAIPLGFDFCFYENHFDSCYISSNGHLTFNSDYSYQPCSHASDSTLPHFDNSFPDNAIFLPFSDYDLQSAGQIQYATIGVAPFRTFIVKFSNLPYFGTLCTNTSITTFQCELHETYNTIDIYIFNKPACNGISSTWVDRSTLGVQSPLALNYHCVNNWNASIWSTQNGAWRIFPNGINAYSITWYDSLNNILNTTSQDSLIFCMTENSHRIHARIVYDCPAKVIWDTVRLMRFPPEVSTSITPTSCKNVSDGMITVTAASPYPPLQYKVDNSGFVNTNVFNNISFGFHTIKVKDALGCITTKIIHVNTSSTLAVNIDSIVSPKCPVDSGMLCCTATGGMPSYTYSWNTGSTDTCLIGLSPGVYTITVEDQMGCKDSDWVLLEYLNVPKAISQVTKSVCGQNGAIDLTVISGIAPFQFLWSTGDTTEDISNLIPTDYTVIITDSLLCTNTYTITVSDTLQVKDTIQLMSPSTCGLSNASIKDFAFNGLAPYQYLWSTGDTTNILNNLAPGTYTCTVTDANLCTSSHTITIDSSVAINLLLVPIHVHCDSANNGSIQSDITNATFPIYYSWSTLDTTSFISNIDTGIYFLNVTDSIGCLASATVTIVDVGTPELTVVNYTPPNCFGEANGQITLNGNGGSGSYKFSLGNNIWTNSPLFTGLSADTFFVRLKDSYQCEIDTFLLLSQPSELIISSIQSDTIRCYDEVTANITIQADSASPPYQYQINNLGWQNSNELGPFGAGLYTVKVKDSHGCLKEKEHRVVGPDNPLSISKVFSNVFCRDPKTGIIDYTISGGWSPYSIRWSHKDTNTTYLDQLKQGVYTIYIEDARGCRISDSTEITQENCCQVFIPNAFSPNGDGLNDILKSNALLLQMNITFAIYNRWGNCVFETHDIHEGWDGNYLGKPAENGTYYYYFSYICNDEKQLLMKKGDVILIR